MGSSRQLHGVDAHTDQVGDEEEDVLVCLVCWRRWLALSGLLGSAIALVDLCVGRHCGAGGIRIARVSLVLGRSGAQILCLSGIAATLCEALVALNSEALVQLVVCVQSLVQVRVPDSGLDSKSKLSLMIFRRIWLQESSDRCEFFGTSRVSQEVQTTSSNARKYQP